MTCDKWPLFLINISLSHVVKKVVAFISDKKQKQPSKLSAVFPASFILFYRKTETIVMIFICLSV